MKKDFLSENQLRIIRVERALRDLRCGMPVLLTARNAPDFYIMASEMVSLPLLREWCNGAAFVPSVVLTAKRCNWLIGKGMASAQKIMLPAEWTEGHIRELIGIGEEEPIIEKSAFQPATTLELTALDIIKYAELMPSVVMVPSTLGGNTSVLSLSAEDFYYYVEHAEDHLTRVTEVPLILKYAPLASIIAYRPMLGGREHYAIVIGEPTVNTTPLVRLHSSCYTGDILASLACDCRDQLQEAIHYMSGQGGGIILYLMQEGRGIGLPNKLRAYLYKHKGHDTVDANEVLGFDDDERLFVPAVKMLEDLGYTSIRLLTNNPRKARELERYGIKVEARIPLHITPTEHTRDYLATKASRLGHEME